MYVPPIADWTAASLGECSWSALWDTATACGDEELLDRLDDADIVTPMLEFKDRLCPTKRLSPNEIFAETNARVIITETGSKDDFQLSDLFPDRLDVAVLSRGDTLTQLSTASAVIICLSFRGFTPQFKEIVRKAFMHQIPFAVVLTDPDSFTLRARAAIRESVEKVGHEVAETFMFAPDEMAPFVCENVRVEMLCRNSELWTEGELYGKPMRALAGLVCADASRESSAPETVVATEELFWNVGTFF